MARTLSNFKTTAVPADQPGKRQMKYAVCQFYPTGDVFPVEINIPTEAKATQLRSWMQKGPSAAEDWRIVEMPALRELLNAGRVSLECFTAEAQSEKRTAILNA